MTKTYIADARLADLAHGGVALPEEIIGMADELRLRRLPEVDPSGQRQSGSWDADAWESQLPRSNLRIPMPPVKEPKK